MKVFSFGFNRCELFARRNVFQMATGERLVVMAQGAESCKNSLVIVNAHLPLSEAVHTVRAFTESGNTVMLYAERNVSILLLREFAESTGVSLCICMEESEFEPCRASVAAHKPYVSVFAKRLLARKRTRYEEKIDSFSVLQRDVLLSLLNGMSMPRIAKDVGTSNGSVRHIKRYISEMLKLELNAESVPLDMFSWLVS